MPSNTINSLDHADTPSEAIRHESRAETNAKPSHEQIAVLI
jgi:hypothetical protein